MAQQVKASVQVRSTSHGRGGAGNINSKPSTRIDADDLTTPTIKSATYSTGRGGTGNMASNDSPAEARRAQDVEAPRHHQTESKGIYRWGRGGEGNKMTVGVGDGERKTKSIERTSNRGTGERRGSLQHAIEKGKGMLGLGVRE